jgi:hypothetical protein
MQMVRPLPEVEAESGMLKILIFGTKRAILEKILFLILASAGDPPALPGWQ